MNVIFLTLVNINSINDRNLYADLLREFRNNGHNVYIVNPVERRFKLKSKLIIEENSKILKIKTLNIQKTNIIEKGISTLLLDYLFTKSVKKHFNNVKFDLVLYSTPPITFINTISYLKAKNNAKTYLLLKDIFPQNAVDLGMIKKGSIIHWYFSKKEIQLYNISDTIGCMSPANVKYLIEHNSLLNQNKIEINSNSIEPFNFNSLNNEVAILKEKYNIPNSAVVFIYGGNLGKPQGLDFLLSVIESNKNRDDLYFLIVGSGTEYSRINKWFLTRSPQNAQLIKYLPKNEYDKLVQVSDVGLIFLDKRFTIPNYPSRLLSYLEFKKPVIIASDCNTDVGLIAFENGYGMWCVNGDLELMNNHISAFTSNKNLISEMGETGYRYLINNYTVKQSYQIIMKHFNSNHSVV